MKGTLLIVDDCPESAALLEIALEGVRTLEVVCVRSAEAAFEWTANERAARLQGVITDLNLPAIDGIELIRRMRARGRGTPIIVVSANADPHAPARALAAGADAFFAKPFSPAEIRKKLEELLHAQG